MSTDPADERAANLDFLSFVDYAIDRVDQEVDEIDPVAMRLVLTLHRVTSSLVYDLESSVHRPRGWSWPGFRVLFVLWLTGPLEAKKIAELTGMSRAAVSSLVNTLDRDGLASRRQAEHDRRSVHITLTEPGREAIAEAFGAHNEREQAWANTLSKPERTILIGLLQKLALGASDAGAKRRS
ncbi:MarR family winged helix-turn-helix transcriptional regulator [Haloactinomyces albus]|uniref:DNA-binding MarR family transcriptional regulator n=1 Tax=Haloactinomyces albus TaxID=1352928 RepID=A0AAE4CN39_9ACTN|nr:MarR family transcriptional regulator [Haloactinomyces albus]MDR7304090.1 DNA-binding MarR family transcriptional regulator [Haloactinomyces albus]